MDRFNLEKHLSNIYSSFPEGSRRPVIGITTNHNGIDDTVRDCYRRQVVKAGGTPLLIPPVADKEVIISTLDRIDGLILSGGADINPLWTGEEPSPKLGHINAARDLPELLMARLAFNRQVPTLAICRGIQTLTIALGGKVAQDLGEVTVQPLRHSQDADFQELTHTVRLESGSMVAQAYGAERIAVNSFHHQCVTHPGEHLRITATAPDGVVEAVESTEHKSIIGVQWHPEWLGDDGQPLFRWLVERSEEFSRAKLLHSQILTIDTHVDTPMFFHQGIHFEQRDPRILVDLHKMTEGRQDAVFMVCYLPQPREGEEFCQRVKSSLATSHIPVILLTARALSQHQIEGYESGADAYITKPFSSDLLLARISNLLKSRQLLKGVFGTGNGEKNAKAEQQPLTEKEDIFLTKFREFIEKNLSDSDLGVETIGAELGLSRVQLYRKIKALTGLSPVELLRTARLQKGRQLLERTDKTISEVAYEVGFTAPSYFTKCFKDEFGISPSDL